MGWQPRAGGGTGASPDRDPGLPGGVPPLRDPRLSWFASDEDGRDALVPTGPLALAADEVCGPERRCPGATDDELTGLLRGWAAIESWAAAGKLGVIAEMIRRDDQPLKGGARQARGGHGDLPDEWSASLRHELALALACPVQSAQATAWLAWELQARLPGIGALLNGGTLTLPKARVVIETFKCLTDADAASAEALIVSRLPGKTYTQVLRLAEQAALTVDPESAARRREQVQRNDARVALFRELSGTAGLSGRDLPPDEALAAMAAVNARAQEYEDSGAFGDTPMDVLRAFAYLDLITGRPAADRIARAEPQDADADIADALAWASERAARERAQSETTTRPDAGRHAGSDIQDDDGDEDDEPGDDGDLGGDGRPGDDKPGGSGPGSAGPGSAGSGSAGSGSGAPRPAEPGAVGPGPGDPSASPAGRALQRRPPDLIVPLLTLLGLTERPGEVQGFGLLDPALARDMAAAAAASPHTTVCITVTSTEGHAVGHGCARPERSSRPTPAGSPPGASSAGLPARLNLTIPDTSLATLTGGVGPWAFAPCAGTGPPHGAGPPDSTGPPDGHGTWALILPGGRRLTARLDTVPVFGCDHRYETLGYHPGAKLRHLVQVRDGTCTFPTCNRLARESDFEHALPYERGGRTCACNAGSRSRACHRVKQSPGWRVTQQPKPGWHQWTTPSGRTYVQEPKRYPA